MMLIKINAWSVIGVLWCKSAVTQSLILIVLAGKEGRHVISSPLLTLPSDLFSLCPDQA